MDARFWKSLAGQDTGPLSQQQLLTQFRPRISILVLWKSRAQKVLVRMSALLKQMHTICLTTVSNSIAGWDIFGGRIYQKQTSKSFSRVFHRGCAKARSFS